MHSHFRMCHFVVAAKQIHANMLQICLDSFSIHSLHWPKTQCEYNMQPRPKSDSCLFNCLASFFHRIIKKYTEINGYWMANEMESLSHGCFVGCIYLTCWSKLEFGTLPLHISAHFFFLLLFFISLPLQVNYKKILTWWDWMRRT